MKFDTVRALITMLGMTGGRMRVRANGWRFRLASACTIRVAGLSPVACEDDGAAPARAERPAPPLIATSEGSACRR
jgi:hypothetical protein